MSEQLPIFRLDDLDTGDPNDTLRMLLRTVAAEIVVSLRKKPLGKPDTEMNRLVRLVTKWTDNPPIYQKNQTRTGLKIAAAALRYVYACSPSIPPKAEEFDGWRRGE